MLFALLLLFADPSGAAALLKEGLLALQAGDLRRADTALTRAAQLDGKDAYIWSALAETRLREGRRNEALDAGSKAEGLGGNDPRVAHALAMFYMHIEQPEKAAPFERRYAESPGADPDAFARAAALYLDAHEPVAAAELAGKAVVRHDTAQAEDTLGRALVATRRNAEAAPHLKRAWDLSASIDAPNEAVNADGQIAFDYSQSLLQAQSFDEAASVAAAFLKGHPRDSQMQLVLGVARYGQRRFDEAIAAFLDVIRIDPAIPQPYLFLANLLEQAGPALDAIVKADEAWVAREPANGQAKLTLAKGLLQQDRKSERARDLLKQAIASNPTAWEPHYQLGVLLETAREYPAAAEELRRSIELNPSQPLPHYHLARVYDRLGRGEEARLERERHQALAH